MAAALRRRGVSLLLLALGLAEAGLTSPACVAETVDDASLPVSADMRRVLANGHLELRERVVYRHRGSGECPPVATVLPGLARMCQYREIVEYTVRPCIEGRTSLTLALQSYDELGKAESALGVRRQAPFAECESHFRAAVEGTRCHLLLVRQWFNATSAAGPCPSNSSRVSWLSRKLVRIMTQTLAVGRAYEWANRHHPLAASFSRARLDSAWCAPTGSGARTGGQLVLNQFVVEGGQAGLRWAGDIFAFMSRDVAPAYMEAWRVWSSINCTQLCMAGGATSACHFVGLARQCTGESPLTAWLCEHFGGSNQSAAFDPLALGLARPQWRRMERLPYPLVHAVNATHARQRMGKPVPVALLVRDLQERRAATCPVCMPACLPGGKKMKARKKGKGAHHSCKFAYQSLHCQFREQERAAKLQRELGPMDSWAVRGVR